MDEAGLAEADFGLCGMYVDIDLFRRHLEEHQHDGERGGRHDVAIGLADGVQDQAVAHQAVIDEDVDGVAIELLQFGLGEEAGQPQKAGDGRLVILIALPRRRLGQAGALEIDFRGDGQQLVERFLAEDLVDALGRLGDGRRRSSAWVAECSSKCLSGWASA